MEHVIALLPALSAQPVLQGIFGALAFILCTFMMLRANKDKQVLPPPAPGGITDVPQIFAQGPSTILDIIREQRDMDRRRTEDSGRIAECVRIIREEIKKQTEILSDMREDQRVETRVAAERHHGTPSR